MLLGLLLAESGEADVILGLVGGVQPWWMRLGQVLSAVLFLVAVKLVFQKSFLQVIIMTLINDYITYLIFKAVVWMLPG
jgi:hypothetical protein